MHSLFADVDRTIEDTAGLQFASARDYRATMGESCPWCHVAPDIGCKPLCPLRLASADDMLRAVDARDSIEQQGGDDPATRRAVICAIAQNLTLRPRLIEALATDAFDLGLFPSFPAARIFVTDALLRAAGDLPSAAEHPAPRPLSFRL